jgi:phenol 2-monooxygenase
MADCIKTDVFISGGGPVGLLIAYGLARQGVDSLLVGKSLILITMIVQVTVG